MSTVQCALKSTKKLPFSLFQFLDHIETCLSEDKDRKLILTLINIERTRPPDLFFGVHSLFSVLRETNIAKLHFSNR